ncbi:site-2 protease family protein [Micromonospora sp. NBC_01813]|uniref:site-2 protease family protein n=1 Tax=Micromonospora sp. NBC_01813 TaxID=2975988 RepID=UPI002DD89D0E|nr:site-2 protease family protein [Micromonospora sp. NBC_01813]WSA10574.1 site-2 protease family protein [Micromonospora sp. NBC_01813]
MEDTAQRSGSRPDRRPGISLGRVLGFPVYLNASVLLLAILVTVLYGQFVRTQLDVPPAARYAVGFGFVVCLLGSVLLHELGHALTARRYGMGVRGITLEMLGGYTEMDRDAPTPKVDLLVALAGPAVSLVLGLVAVVVTLLLPDRTLINQLAFQLAVANLLVAVFNSLPGLPLDGGRALRAAVWAMTRDRHVGTEAAGWVGRAVAAGTAGLVVLLTIADILSPFGLVFMLLVSFTLWQGAGQSIRVARIGRRFPLIDLAVLARPIFTVPSGTPLAEAQRRSAEEVTAPGRGESALGVADSAGRLVALVDRAAAAAVPPERRPWVAVDTVARGVDGVRRIPLGLAGEHVVRTVQEHPGAQYLVTRDEDVVGVLHVADLAQLLEPNRKMSL